MDTVQKAAWLEHIIQRYTKSGLSYMHRSFRYMAQGNENKALQNAAKARNRFEHVSVLKRFQKQHMYKQGIFFNEMRG